MKAILEFNLPEETTDFKMAQEGPGYKFVLEDLDNWLRSLDKHEDKETVTIQEVRDEVYKLLDERNLRLFE